ncbi:LytR/AlgR family response regulator transcription factor [Winogradskyella endarachnes]|uniref:Response regulator n=1 Tax=Winogradskyella endarachnes TaxID=2681965 RepID=A0A6L6UCL3_9FLAO|nr:LytTR family DNA-binding domain-containing protein [Winogradskyella endarachnes]MUU78637.1 response regulator [Winogradskyella endarachnes]
MKILIIEDEIKTAQLLYNYALELRPDAEVLPFVHKIDESIKVLTKQSDIDIIFMDIQLADGSCFEIFKEVQVNCPVIFCTAYDEYALKAFDANGIAYILKPFDEKAIAKALNKYDQFSKKNDLEVSVLMKLKNIIANDSVSKQVKSFLVFHRNRYLPIELDHIAYFYIRNELTYIYTYDEKSYSIDLTLNTIEDQVSQNIFFRANRQFLIHHKAVKEIENYFARKLLVTLKVATPERIIVSKAKATKFIQWMQSS